MKGERLTVRLEGRPSDVAEAARSLEKTFEVLEAHKAPTGRGERLQALMRPRAPVVLHR